MTRLNWNIGTEEYNLFKKYRNNKKRAVALMLNCLALLKNSSESIAILQSTSGIKKSEE